MKKILAVVLLSFILMPSCMKTSDSSNQSAVSSELIKTPNVTATVEPSLVHLDFLTKQAFSSTRSPAEMTDMFKKAFSDIALNSLKLVYENDKNIVFSPLSEITAIALITNGANGNTLNELLSLFDGINNIDDLNTQLFSFRERLESYQETHIKETDAIFWGSHSSFTVADSFISLVENTYRAEIAKVDFLEPDALKSINKWISDHTDRLISAAVNSSDVNEYTLMLMVDAVCLDGEWQRPFTEIFEDTFHGSNGDRRVKMMSSTEYGFISGDNETGFLKLFEGGQFGLAALLPHEGISIDQYVSGLNGRLFLELISNANADCRTRVVLPAFQNDAKTDIRDILKKLGAENIFAEEADFTGFGTYAEGSSAGLGKVFQNASFELCETGTKAASASVVAVTSCPTEAPCDETLILDRPFVYAVVDLYTGLPIFLGLYQTV